LSADIFGDTVICRFLTAIPILQRQRTNWLLLYGNHWMWCYGLCVRDHLGATHRLLYVSDVLLRA